MQGQDQGTACEEHQDYQHWAVAGGDRREDRLWGHNDIHLHTSGNFFTISVSLYLSLSRKHRANMKTYRGEYIFTLILQVFLSICMSLCLYLFPSLSLSLTWDLLLFGYKQLIVINFYAYYHQEKICWRKFICFWAIMHCLGSFSPFYDQNCKILPKTAKKCLINAL